MLFSFRIMPSHTTFYSRSIVHGFLIPFLVSMSLLLRSFYLGSWNPPHLTRSKNTHYEAAPKTESCTSFSMNPGSVAPSVKHPRESWADSHWMLESLALLISFISLFAMFILLVKFNNRQLHKWHSAITLNTIVAITSLVSKAALIPPPANGLSQLRWMWYRHGSSRRLIDFEYFDATSRGPWGALVMIIHIQTYPLATLGTFVMAMAVAFEPFIQQAVVYPSRNATVGIAGILRIDYWNGAFGPSFKVGAYDALLGFNLSKQLLP